jgi:hypothetical protein
MPTHLNLLDKTTLVLHLIEAIPLCVQNRYRKICQTQQTVIYCYTGQLVLTQLWGQHQASNQIRINENERHIKNMCALQDPFGLHRTAVHTKCQIIYKNWTFYVDVVKQLVYQMGKKVTECCKGATMCEVDSGMLTGIIGYIFF